MVGKAHPVMDAFLNEMRFDKQLESLGLSIEIRRIFGTQFEDDTIDEHTRTIVPSYMNVAYCTGEDHSYLKGHILMGTSSNLSLQHKSLQKYKNCILKVFMFL